MASTHDRDITYKQWHLKSPATQLLFQQPNVINIALLVLYKIQQYVYEAIMYIHGETSMSYIDEKRCRFQSRRGIGNIQWELSRSLYASIQTKFFIDIATMMMRRSMVAVVVVAATVMAIVVMMMVMTTYHISKGKTDSLYPWKWQHSYVQCNVICFAWLNTPMPLHVHWQMYY